ncbi:Nn.00g105370.m01.CDS01 [Neocucurbitaria sp. VM-36]
MLPKKKPRKDEYLSKHLRDRDIKFLVDDADTMSEHWDEATFLIETLVMKAHGQDPDGPDLSFTNCTIEFRQEKDAAAFRRAMQRARPRKDNLIRTNIKTALTPIFNNYLSMVGRAYDKSKVNALTVIILTDGLWMGMIDPDEIIEKVVEFDQELKKRMDGMMNERQVSLQFIQFGDDEEARERLRRLDDDMPYRGIDDMIDFERFSVTGNVFKMLLGSFVEEMDAIDDSVEDLLSSPEASPPARGSTPTRNLTLRPIAEGLHEGLSSPAGYFNSMPHTPPMQQKGKKSGSFAGFIAVRS